MRTVRLVTLARSVDWNTPWSNPIPSDEPADKIIFLPALAQSGRTLGTLD
jgi:hypothetical protein